MLLAPLFCALLFLSTALARSTEPALAPGWMVDHWTVADGLPIGHFTGAVRTPDGMLWLSSYDGLIRFDGHEFVTLRPADLPGLSSSRLEAIAADARGHLWLVTEQRDLVRVVGGVAQTWSAASLPSPPVEAVLEGGQLWVRCAEDLLRVVDGAPRPVAASRAPAKELGLLQDFAVARDGGVWLAYQRGLLHLDAAGQLLGRYGVDEGLRGADLTSVVLDAAGVPTVTDLDGVLRLESGRFTRLPLEGDVPTGGVCAVVPEEDDALTILGATGTWWRAPDGQAHLVDARTPRTCQDGAARRKSGRWQAGEHAVTLDGVELLRPGGTARAIVPDGDAAWVITIGNGIFLIRPALVGQVEGLNYAPGGVLAAPSGERIALIQRSLVRIDQGIRPVTILDAAGQVISGVVWQDAAAVDARGRLWFGGRGGLCELRRDSCQLLSLPWAEPRPLVVDGAGALWLDTASGLGRTPPGQGPEEGWELVEAHGPEAGVRMAARLRDGSVIVAVEHQGLRHFIDGRVDTWTRADAMGLDLVRDLVVDGEGLLWVATVDGGLCRLDLRDPDPPEKPRPTCLNSRQGLPVDTVHAVSFDRQGRIWMSSNHGIFYVRRAEVEAALNGDAAALSPLMFTERDGMPHREANGTAWPTVGRAPDGRLYYPTQLGIAVVDPTTIAPLSPPAVRVESMAVDGAPVSWQEGASFSSEQRDVAFTWTAPEFRWPEQLRFRYRLVGYDDAWSALGTERHAAWTNLPPGDYTFEVEAALGGAWSRAPARVPFSRAPAFVETLWFPASIGAGALLIAGAVVWVRSRNRRARIRALEEEVQRRTAVLAERNADLASRNAVIAAQAERLAELDSLKSAFVSNLSHELRTPLTLVLGPLEELRDAPEGLDARRRASVAIAHRNAERLRELVQQLFDVARLETGGLPLRARRQDLGAFVRQVVGRFTSAATERGLTLEASAADGVIAWFDPDLIDKVLTNLIGNALKFTPANGRVAVEMLADPAAEGADRAAAVSVTDTGVGVSATEQSRIFERFYQVDSADRRKHGGAGIGLSLARELVELHGGALTVHSEPGRGSAFRFTLPLGSAHLRPEELDLSPASASLPGGALEGGGLEEDAAELDDEGGIAPTALVLVVEDHPDLRTYIADHLGQRFRVQTAPDGAAALDAIRAQRPDVVVSDVMMPHLDGISMCRALRADPALADLPVILVSAKGAEADRRAGLEVAQAWFSKPFRMRELEEAVLRLAPPPPQRAAAPDGARLPPEAMTDEDRLLLGRLEALVQERLADPELSVALLAKRLALSRRQLLREVSRLTGQPVVSYIQRARMEAARDMLRRDRTVPVSEVAASVGMNRAYFSRLYSAWHGRSPSEDRDMG